MIGAARLTGATDRRGQAAAPAPIDDAKPAVVGQTRMLPTPAAAEYKRTQPPAGRVQMARGAASKAAPATQAATAAGEEIKNTTSSAGPKIKFQHGPRRKPLRGGGTVPALALPSPIIIAPGRRAARRRRRHRAADGRGHRAFASARDSAKREGAQRLRGPVARARVAATRLKAPPSASNQLTRVRRGQNPRK